jgi:hypothetical protein
MKGELNEPVKSENPPPYRYYWYKCRKKTVSYKKPYLLTPPKKYLYIVIKRNSNSSNSFYVSIPMQLDITPYCSDQNKTAKYRLYGVIQHFGDPNFGHYKAVVKDNDEWFLCNDSIVTKIENPLEKPDNNIINSVENDNNIINSVETDNNIINPVETDNKIINPVENGGICSEDICEGADVLFYERVDIQNE